MNLAHVQQMAATARSDSSGPALSLASEQLSESQAQLVGMQKAHAAATVSALAARLLNEWDVEIGKFWQVVPTEIVARLEMPLSDDDAAQAGSDKSA